MNEAANDKGSISKTSLSKFIRENKNTPDEAEALGLANEILLLFDQESKLKKKLKAKTLALDESALAQFQQLTEEEVRSLVVKDKWLACLQAAIQTEIDAISQRLTSRIKELAERYEHTLGELDQQAKNLEEQVNTHLEKMGLSWN